MDESKDKPTGDWRKYNRWNRRDERMAELWVRGLVKYLRTMPGLNADSTVLDYGCGYFDAGLSIIDRVARVDGLDIEERTAEAARMRAAPWPSTRIYGNSADLSRESYDLIIANSVFQYLGNDEEVLQTLRLFRTLLKPEGRGEVLVGDLIPLTYSSVKDAFRSLWVACKHGMLYSMIVHLYKAAFKSDGLRLHQIAPDRFAQLSGEAGFRCERLPVNLTPSRQRYSCMLRPAE